jgi:hypothetical protein
VDSSSTLIGDETSAEANPFRNIGPFTQYTRAMLLGQPKRKLSEPNMNRPLLREQAYANTEAFREQSNKRHKRTMELDAHGQEELDDAEMADDEDAKISENAALDGADRDRDQVELAAQPQSHSPRTATVKEAKGKKKVSFDVHTSSTSTTIDANLLVRGNLPTSLSKATPLKATQSKATPAKATTSKAVPSKAKANGFDDDEELVEVQELFGIGKRCSQEVPEKDGQAGAIAFEKPERPKRAPKPKKFFEETFRTGGVP